MFAICSSCFAATASLAIPSQLTSVKYEASSKLKRRSSKGSDLKRPDAARRWQKAGRSATAISQVVNKFQALVETAGESFIRPERLTKVCTAFVPLSIQTNGGDRNMCVKRVRAE